MHSLKELSGKLTDSKQIQPSMKISLKTITPPPTKKKERKKKKNVPLR